MRLTIVSGTLPVKRLADKSLLEISITIRRKKTKKSGKLKEDFVLNTYSKRRDLIFPTEAGIVPVKLFESSELEQVRADVHLMSSSYLHYRNQLVGTTYSVPATVISDTPA